ncbi:response regulator transcription factor [Terribacillus sp. DMT04]|uniref:response regulator transcription factor n=1 Tax=Terribacillus sp. DMT04 TaxID=2850441 RepID=UPI001C2C815F|nr:response regulator transcription factor [Terribacillus sp. DMT04]QXE03596.1 response regulator transcription factor [Terribacillus sp. DMT04]
MSREEIEIFIVDPQPLYREGIKLILSNCKNIVIKAEGESIRDIEEIIDYSGSPIILFATNHSRDLQDIEVIKRYNPHFRIVSLSEYIDENIVTEAIKKGADGFIVKDKAGSEDLIAAIYSLHNEGCYLHPCITKFVIDEYKKLLFNTDKHRYVNSGLWSYPNLTKREEETLKLIAEGLSNKDIGNKLHISEKTVKNHVSNLMRKLNVSDRTQAIILAFKNGWL